jgi:hypothetical protein
MEDPDTAEPEGTKVERREGSERGRVRREERDRGTEKISNEGECSNDDSSQLSSSGDIAIQLVL